VILVYNVKERHADSEPRRYGSTAAKKKSLPEMGTIVHLAVSADCITFSDGPSVCNKNDIVDHFLSNLRRIRRVLTLIFSIILIRFPVCIGAPVRQLP
jgi:hypothetical protein